MGAMKRLLILVAVLAGLVLPGTAGAAVPCRDRVFNDWYHDGRIASTYPTACYRDALQHIPADARIYSSLSTDIKAAMLAAIRRQHGSSVPKQVGHGFKIVTHRNAKGQLVSEKGELVSLGKVGTHDSPQGADAAGSIADTASGAPLPILVLGGIALALAAAGAIGTGVRHVRRRR
jgi:hypothetical protein